MNPVVHRLVLELVVVLVLASEMLVGLARFARGVYSLRSWGQDK